jgi:hypothetical protein
LIAPPSRAVCSARLVGILGVAVLGEESDVVVGAAGVDAVKLLSEVISAAKNPADVVAIAVAVNGVRPCVHTFVAVQSRR